MPPVAGKRKWSCPSCGDRFRITSKDAGRIMRRADERGEDLGAYEPFLIAAILEKAPGKKKKKKARSGKLRSSTSKNSGDH
jgi:hypothetical protein